MKDVLAFAWSESNGPGGGVGRFSKLMQILRLIIVSLVCGGLVWFLSANLISGLRTGKIGHTDSSQICDWRKQPVYFVFLSMLNLAFIAVLLAGWWGVILDVIAS